MSTQAEDLVEHAVQCGLVLDISGQASPSVRDPLHVEAVEPVRPVPVETGGDMDLVSHELCAFVSCSMLESCARAGGWSSPRGVIPGWYRPHPPPGARRDRERD